MILAYNISDLFRKEAYITLYYDHFEVFLLNETCSVNKKEDIIDELYNSMNKFIPGIASNKKDSSIRVYGSARYFNGYTSFTTMRFDLPNDVHVLAKILLLPKVRIFKGRIFKHTHVKMYNERFMEEYYYFMKPGDREIDQPHVFINYSLDTYHSALSMNKSGMINLIYDDNSKDRNMEIFEYVL